jgi:hypothetical protein
MTSRTPCDRICGLPRRPSQTVSLFFLVVNPLFMRNTDSIASRPRSAVLRSPGASSGSWLVNQLAERRSRSRGGVPLDLGLKLGDPRFKLRDLQVPGGEHHT